MDRIQIRSTNACHASSHITFGSSHTPTHGESMLFRLPRELRDHIFDFVFQDCKPIYINCGYSSHIHKRSIDGLIMSRQFYAEAYQAMCRNRPVACLSLRYFEFLGRHKFHQGLEHIVKLVAAHHSANAKSLLLLARYCQGVQELNLYVDDSKYSVHLVGNNLERRICQRHFQALEGAVMSFGRLRRFRLVTECNCWLLGWSHGCILRQQLQDFGAKLSAKVQERTSS